MCCVKMILSSSSEYICDLFYLPPTKLREGNIFTGVCLFRGVGSYPLPTPPTYLLPNHLSTPATPTYLLSPLKQWSKAGGTHPTGMHTCKSCIFTTRKRSLGQGNVFTLHLAGGGGFASRGSACRVYPSPLWTE